MYCFHFLTLDDFASGCKKFVIFRSKIREQLSIVIDIPQSIKVRISYIVKFIAGVSGYESSTCKIKLKIKIILIG